MALEVDWVVKTRCEAVHVVESANNKRSDPRWKTIAILGVGAVSMLGFRQTEPFLVDVLVHDDTVTPIRVIEIWSDRQHYIRDIGLNEIAHYRCGPNLHCTDKFAHCRIVSEPITGQPCEYCVSTGGATGNFCWEVDRGVCKKTGGSVNCGTMWTSTCAVAAGEFSNSCTGGTVLATCSLENCVEYD